MLLETLVAIICASLCTHIVYTLFFHPLSSIPGPKLAAISSLYETYYDVILPGRYVFKIRELHKRYGPIIRVTPREVHVNDVSLLQDIYPTSIAKVRHKDPVQIRGLDIGLSTAASVDHDVHRRRREYMAPFFSQKNVIAREPMLVDKVEQMRTHVENSLVNNQVINLYDIFYAFARDVVYQASFAKDSDELRDLESAAVLRHNLTRLLLGSKAVKRFPWVFKMIQRLPTALAMKFRPVGVKDMQILVMRIRGEVMEVCQAPSTENGESSVDHNETDGKGKKRHHSIFHDIWENRAIPPAEKSPLRLQSEGAMLVMAGTESTAKTLGICVFHLLSQPALLNKLRSELQAGTSWPQADIVQLQQLPYLSAVIKEGVRLGFGLTGRNARIIPDEDLRCGKHVIPRGTPVSSVTLCVHTDPSIFPDPYAFQPERWLGENGNRLEKYNLGFGKGSRRCLGIQLANAEMVLALASIARYNMELWDTTEDDVAFMHDYQVAFPVLTSKGIRVKVKERVI